MEKNKVIRKPEIIRIYVWVEQPFEIRRSPAWVYLQDLSGNTLQIKDSNINLVKIPHFNVCFKVNPKKGRLEYRRYVRKPRLTLDQVVLTSLLEDPRVIYQKALKAAKKALREWEKDE